MSHDQEFKQAMKGVRPIKKKPLAVISPARHHKRKKVKERRVDKTESVDFWYDDHLEPATRFPEERLFFSQPGVQPKTLKNLELGKLVIEATLDLHGLRISDAYTELQDFLKRCSKRQCRVVLVIHGKGSGKLKNAVYEWLKEYPDTLALTSASRDMGGTGAVFLLLKRF